MNSTDIRTVKLLVNSGEAKEKIADIQREIDILRRKKDEALKMGNIKGNKAYTAELKKREGELERMQSRAQNVERALKNIDKATPKELRRTIAQINGELNSGAIERGSKEWNVLSKAMKDCRTELQKIQKEQKGVSESNGGMKSWFKNAANIFMTFQGAMYAISGLKSTMQQSVQAFAEMEEAEADVMKYTGMTKAQVEDLNKSLKEMDTRTGREQLNALAGDAGRLGIKSKQEILEFVDAADKINIALGEDLGEDAVKNIGKLAMLFGENKRIGLRQAMLSTGSAINELAQNSSAAETYILDFTARLAGVSKQANIAQADIMGYAAVLDESMLRDETAATAMQQLIVKIFQDPAKMAKAAGLEVKAFSELVRTDANAALLQFFDAMKARGGFDSLAPMFQEMHLNGQRAVGVLSAVADKTDLLRERQQLANQAYAEANSIQNEFDVKNNTVQAQLDKAKKRFHDLAVELGERLYPIMTSGIHLTSTLTKATIKIVDWVTKNGKSLVWLAGVIAAWTLAVKAHIIAEKLSFALFRIQYAFREGALSSWAALTAAIKGNIVVSTLSNAVIKAGNVIKAAWAVVTELVTGKTIALTAAQTALTIAMRKNPIGFIVELLLKLVAVLLTVFGVYKWLDSIIGDSNKKLSQQEKLVADSINLHKRVAESVASETSRVKTLTAIIHDNSRSYGERMRAIKTLQKIVPGYTATIDRETGALKENAKAVADYITMLKKKAMAEAVSAANAELAGQIMLNEQSRDRRQQAVNIRKNRLSVLKSEHREISGWIEQAASGKITVAEVARRAKKGSGEKYSIKELEKVFQEAKDIAESIKEAEKWVAEQDVILEGLNQRIEENSKTAQKYGADVVDAIDAATNSVQPTNVSTGPGGGASSSDDKKHADKTEKEHRERMKALEAEAKDLERELQKKREELAQDFVQGKKDIDQYRTAVQQAEMQTAMQQRDLYDKTLDWQVEKWKERDDKVRQLQQKQLQERHDWSIEALEHQQQAELNALEERHARGLVKDEAYELERAAITLKYLRRRAAYYQQWGDASQWQKAQAEVEKESHRQRIAQLEELRRKTEEFRKEFEQKTPEQQYREMLDTFKKAEAQALAEAGIDAARIAQVRGEFASMRQAAWKKYYGPGGEVQKALSERSQKQLTEAGYFDQERTRRSDTGAGSDLAGSFIGAAGAADNLARIRSQYDLLKQLRQQNLVDEQTYNEELKRLDQETAENKVAVWQAAFAYIGAIASSISQLYQAQQQAEEASVTERYDREIQKAGENSARGKKLEEQKQKELAKIKTKYNKREMVIEMAQAAASTAMAAINAYASASKISWVLGPIAASMALAAGAIQMAAIKKQHDAQQKGYYEGGFTGGRRYRREAGVVHEGEFVASHEAVGNPNLLPVLNLIDQAQRRNRVASLTAEDVARTLYPAFAAQPAAAAAAPMVQVVDSSSERTAEALEKLNSQLDQPIQTYVVLDGPEGLHHQYGRYLRMIAKK